jgi:hypothetical protein
MSTPLASHPLEQEAGKRWSAKEDGSSGCPVRTHISSDDLWCLAMEITPLLKGALPSIPSSLGPLGAYQEFEAGFRWLQPFDGHIECEAREILKYVSLTVHC